MTKPWYDTKEGIAEKVHSLLMLSELRRVRYEACYDRKEYLEEFILFNRWYFDRCGNMGRLQRPLDSASVPVRLANEVRGFAATMSDVVIPRAGQRCPECSWGWTLANADDYVAGPAASPNDTRVLWHRSCYVNHQTKSALAAAFHALEIAGFRTVHCYASPNEYCNCERCPPWVIAEADGFVLKMGLRKRVYQLDWSATGRVILDGITSDDVTQGDTYMHAWSVAKLSEYLTTLRRVLYRCERCNAPLTDDGACSRRASGPCQGGFGEVPRRKSVRVAARELLRSDPAADHDPLA